jgi:hypothetical protein
MTLQLLAARCAAFIFAALIPALAVAGLGQSIRLLPYAFAITLGHALILGLPAFLILQMKRWVNAATSTGAGFAIGVMPIAVLTWPLQPAAHFNASTNGVRTIVEGVPTVEGWFEYLQLLLTLGGLGALGGVAFWAVLRVSDGLKNGIPNLRRGPVLAVTAALLSAAVFAIPSVMMDRTCHNMFRDGRRSVGPQVYGDLPISFEDWPTLTHLMANFASDNALSLRDSSKPTSDVVRVLALSLCNETGVNIEIREQRWASHNFEPLIQGRGVSVGVYELREGSGWEDIARDLVGRLEATWPGQLRFRDSLGRTVPIPKKLEPADNQVRTAPRSAE